MIKKRELINKSLKENTGNDYITYVDLCKSMNVINDNLIKKFEPTILANIFTNAFGLQTISKTDSENNIENIALNNRLLSVLFDYSDIQSSHSWSKIIGQGIFAFGKNKKSGFLLKPDSENIFSLYEIEANEIKLEERNNNNLNLVDLNSKNGKETVYKLIDSGNDISDFYDFFQEKLLEKKDEIKNNIKINKSNNFNL